MTGTWDKYRAIYIGAAALLLFACVSCGGGGGSSDKALQPAITGSSASSPESAIAIPENERVPAPAEDAPSMDDLSRILSTELERLGKDPERTTAKAPSGVDNAAFDLVVAYRSHYSGATLHWTERLVGDYDMNGEVNASDLTPIAQRWKFLIDYLPPDEARGFVCWPKGHPRNGGFSGVLNGFPGFNTPAHQWRTARIDGDDNGEINAADITPIAQQWQERVDSYRIYRMSPDEDEFSMLRLGEEDTYTIPRSIHFKPGETAPDPSWVYRLHYADVTIHPGTYQYYLAPYDSLTDDEGTPSPVISITFDDRNPPPPPEGNQPPEIIVTADVTSGDAPLRVEFDASGSSDPDGEIVLYVWDWEGDGQVDASSQSSPYAYHIYNEIGWYHPQLTIWDDMGGSATATIDIEVGVGAGGVLPPKLDLSVSPTEGPAPLTVEFIAEATAVDGIYSGMHYEVDYESDGELDFTYGLHPMPPQKITYEETGTHRLTVSAVNFAGLRTSAFVDVTVNDNIGPQAVIRLTPPMGNAPLVVHVSGLDSSDQDSTELSYEWTIDGEPYDDSGEPQPGEFDKSYPKIGEHVFGLTVTDGGGLSDYAEETLTVIPPEGDLPPVAVASADPVIGAAPLKVLVSPEGSYDPENLPVTFLWDPYGTGNFRYYGMAGVSFTYDVPGIYDLALQVQDAYGQVAFDSVQITVIDNHPPVAALSASPTSGDAPLMVALDATGSSDPDGDTLSFEWDYIHYPGDKTWEAGEALEGFEYKFGGQHLARVRVTDQWGASSIAEATIQVTGPGWYVVKIDDGNADWWSPDIGLELVDGNPAVAYSHGGAARFSRGEDTDGLSWTTPIDVGFSDDIYGGVLGPSLSYVNGAPCLGWMHHSGEVKYCRALDSTGASWQDPNLVYYIGGSGSGTDIMEVDGHPAMLWVDALGHMRYSRAFDNQGATWGLPYDFGQISLGQGNYQAEMAVVNGHISVANVNSDWFLPGVMYRWSNDIHGAVWNDPVVVNDTSNSSIGVSMTTIAGNPVVAYYCELGLVFQTAPDGIGNSWSDPVVITPEHGGSIGGLFLGDEVCIAELNGVPAVLDSQMGLWIAENANGTSWYGPEHIPNYASGTTFALLDVDGQPAIAWHNSAVYYGVKLD